MTKKTDDTPSPDDTPKPTAPEAPPPLEQPSEGGSYIRQPDGTLVKQEG